MTAGAAAAAIALPGDAPAQAPETKTMNEFTYRTARDTATALAARQVSAAELTDRAIARIEARNRDLDTL